jgi:hypothetical protein
VTSLFTIDQAAERLRKSGKWLQEWLCEHPTSWSGMPYYAAIGRTKLFTDENIRWIARAIEDQKAELKEHKEAAKNDDGFIYFIEAGDFIKICYTRSPVARGIKMKTDSPFDLRLLHIEDGTFKREKLYHRRTSRRSECVVNGSTRHLNSSPSSSSVSESNEELGRGTLMIVALRGLVAARD